MKRIRWFIPTAVVWLAAAGGVEGQVTQTFGSGSAVTTVDAAADFESTAALFGNPYVENGLSFSRTGMTFNNNSCGFAGCGGSFSYYTGNYMYGNGPLGSYFSMFLTGGQRFAGLEFRAGVPWTSATFFWEALLEGSSIGSGTGSLLQQPTVLGFYSVGGFDELRYGWSGFGTCQGASCTVSNASSFDAVRAQFATVPEPESFLLVATGLIGLLAVRLRRRDVGNA